MIMFGSKCLPADTLHGLMVFGVSFFAGITFLQIIILVVQKIVLENLNYRRALLRDHYLSLMQEAVSNGNFDIRKPHSKAEYEVFADVCIQLIPGYSSGQVEFIQSMVRQFGIPEYFTASFVNSRLWTRKYQIIEKLGFLKLPELGATYRETLELNNENRLVISKLVWALSLICREPDLSVILKSLSAPDFMSAKFNEYIFCNAIESFKGRGETEQLMDYFRAIMDDENISSLLKRDFIQACGVAGIAEAEGLIVHCARRFGTRSEMRIACIRAIQGTGGEALDRMVVAGLHDADWRVRAVAAKDVQKCSPRIIPFLESALGDQNYYVRLNAALSLAKKGEAGLAVLRTMSLSNDRFIRDVSKYVLTS
jgi:hypothetical protein